MTIHLGNEISLRGVEIKDAELLEKWLSDPHVLQYYEGRDRSHDREMVINHYYLDRDKVTQAIIQYRGVDIGYIQFYLIDEEVKEKYNYQNYQGNIYGMDQFIGETDYWNRGIGTQLIKETVKYLFDQKKANKIVMDPQAWNSSYSRCGPAGAVLDLPDGSRGGRFRRHT